jgi:Helicase conserved C-terminal domain
VSRFYAEPILAPLKDFQRATVEHVTDRLYRSAQPSRRFLVADETGLGKSLVARGVIARAIEQLQDDDSVDRIDVVYVCSNSDIADQNLKRLNVTGQDHLPFASRLTLLAKYSRRLADAAGTAAHGKRVNLVSFTPGTSFEMGWRTGKAEERAMLHLFLVAELGLSGRAEKSSRMLLQGTVQELSSFTGSVQRLRAEMPDLDPVIAERFATECRRKKYLARFEGLIDELGRKQSVPAPLKDSARALIPELRAQLAQVSVETLEPDLVILDEFQRFRYLLDLKCGGPAAELAHNLFDYPAARVLLLSATPYKAFTLAEEERGGEDHFADFMRTVSFLAQGSPLQLDQVKDDLAGYRSALIAGADASKPAKRLRDQLLLVMSRTERPQLGKDSMLRERSLYAAPLQVADLTGFAALRRVAESVNSSATVEYWKSVPYFINFMDGYQLADRVRDGLKTAAEKALLEPLLSRTQRLDRAALDRFGPHDLGNGRLRALAADTVGRGWWQLLWVPPSMPYFTPGGPYSDASAQSMTKRLIFSSWSAAPTAIAALLSYEAERRTVQDTRLTSNTASARAAIATRLDYDLRGGQPTAMSALALFWPHPALAALADPIELARERPDQTISVATAEQEVARRLSPVMPRQGVVPAGDGAHWRAMLEWPGAVPDLLAGPAQIAEAMASEEAAEAADIDQYAAHSRGLHAHVRLALDTINGQLQPTAGDRNELLSTLAAIATHSPANITYRSLTRVLSPGHKVSDAGLWKAAATLAAGLRSLFNRLDSTLLLDKLYDTAEPYWRTVLRYCADGNLQAVLDEYLHHLRSEEPTVVMDDEHLMALARRARDAVSMRPSRYESFDPDDPSQPISFRSRFALRYGSKRYDVESARQPQVRNAFNSPFWPFVLTTTSVGQEGIDFHWWCHAVVHWNLPANPVDFEQREGRINRFGGHAVRRNIAARHRVSVMTSQETDPWKAAYDAARDQSAHLGEFAPYWIYPGPFKVERQLINYPLSRDTAKLVALKDDLALYRLAFGQPRQEDLLDFLKRRGVDSAGTAGIDLRPDAVRPPSSIEADPVQPEGSQY